MNQQMVLESTVEALRIVAEPRFFRIERGYHGRSYCTLQATLERRGLLADGVIWEMEYQKSERHRLAKSVEGDLAVERTFDTESQGRSETDSLSPLPSHVAEGPSGTMSPTQERR